MFYYLSGVHVEIYSGIIIFKSVFKLQLTPCKLMQLVAQIH